MIAGVVLAGGLSQRFGSDKAEALYRGRPLLDWSIAALRRHCDIVLVSGREHPPHEMVIDRPRAGLGPLGGIAGALFAARAKGYSDLLSLPCDTPEVPDPLLAALCNRGHAAYAAVCPVIGIWPVSLADALEKHLREGGARSVRRWAEVAGIAPIEGELAPLANINAVEDLRRIEG